MMRRTIPLTITLIAGIVLFSSRFLPGIEAWGEDASIWFDILAAIAFILGGGNLLKVHTQKARKQVPGWGFSMVTIFFFLFVLTMGLGKIGAVPSENYPYGLYVTQGEGPVAWVVVDEKVHAAALQVGGTVKLGSGETAEIRLAQEIPAHGVAPIHCKIDRREDGFYLVDGENETGTYLDGKRVTEPIRLSDGDAFRTGEVGDPVVHFRTAGRFLLQVVHPADREEVIVGSHPEADVHLIGEGVGSTHGTLGHITEDDAAKEGGAGKKSPIRWTPGPGGTPVAQILGAGDTFDLGPLHLVYRPNGRLTGDYQYRGSVFMYCYNNGMKPLQAATFAMLAFYVASAAYRAFRAKNVEAIILLGTAFLILLGRTYLGTVVTAWVPESADFLTVPKLTVWIMQVINSAGNRAIMIGISLGIASTSLKVILGIDRSYLGGEG